MLPLIPLAISIAPMIAKWIFGGDGEAVAKQVGEVISSVTGVTDTHTTEGIAAVEAVIQGKPELAAQIQVQLMQIAAQREEAQRKSDLEELTAAMANTANARSMTLGLVQSGSVLAFEGAAVDFFVLGLFSLSIYLLMTHSLPDAGLNRDLTMGLMGTISTLAVTVVQYWRGSSASSRSKDGTIANLTNK